MSSDEIMLCCWRRNEKWTHFFVCRPAGLRPFSFNKIELPERKKLEEVWAWREQRKVNFNVEFPCLKVHFCFESGGEKFSVAAWVPAKILEKKERNFNSPNLQERGKERSDGKTLKPQTCTTSMESSVSNLDKWSGSSPLKEKKNGQSSKSWRVHF